MDRRLASVWGLAFLVFFVTACGSPHRSVRKQNVARDAAGVEGAPRSGMAMLVASLTAQNLDFHRPGKVVLPFYRDKVSNPTPIVMRIHNGIPRPKSGRQSDFADVQGKLFSTELPPGDYQMWPWVVYDSEYFVSPSKSPYWRFTLKPDQVLYLGNFHFGLIEGTHVFSKLGGASNISKVKFELREQFDRDSQVLLKRYPGMKIETISREGPMALNWSVAAQVNDKTSNGLLGFLQLLRGISFSPL